MEGSVENMLEVVIRADIQHNPQARVVQQIAIGQYAGKEVAVALSLDNKEMLVNFDGKVYVVGTMNLANAILDQNWRKGQLSI